MKAYPITLIVLLCFFACNKKLQEQDAIDDFKGREEIKGRLMYHNLFSGSNDTLPLAGRKVYLAYAPSDTVEYLYYTLTDVQGNFRFTHLYANKAYDLFTRDTIEGVIFSSFTSVMASQVKIDLIAANDVRHQTGILFRVVDQNAQPFYGARVCLFNNEQLYLGNSCVGSIASNTTDAQGRVAFYSLNAGQYFAKVETAAGSTRLRADTSFSYTPAGVLTIMLTLRSEPEVKNGIEVRTVDERGNLFPGSQVCLFNNAVFFHSDSCSKAIASIVANSNGIITFPNLAPGTYYLLAQQTFRDTLYRGTDTVIVTAEEVQKTTIYMKASTLNRNQLNIRVVDVFGGPVYQTQVCIFNSRVLFNTDTCVGSVATGQTDVQGRTQFKNLPNGLYFIRARAQFDTLLLKGADSVFLKNNASFSRTIRVQ